MQRLPAVLTFNLSLKADATADRSLNCPLCLCPQSLCNSWFDPSVNSDSAVTRLFELLTAKFDLDNRTTLPSVCSVSKAGTLLELINFRAARPLPVCTILEGINAAGGQE